MIPYWGENSWVAHVVLSLVLSDWGLRQCRLKERMAQLDIL